MYEIVISRIALNDIVSISEYIKNRFDNPLAAISFRENVREKILSLSDFPERYEKINIGKIYCHKVCVKNFNIYYSVNKSDHKVTIARVLYSGMDINQVAIIN